MTPCLRLVAAIAIGALSFALGGCTVNPATGEQTFTGLMRPADEVRIGRQQHPGIVKAFGGEYGSPDLRKYVDSIGQLLASTTERRDLGYTFTVLNSDVVNAFALPGGYIYVSRGLLALAGNEAELAAVLAHELGHVTALHHAQRRNRDLLASVLVTGLGLAGGSAVAESGAALAQGVLRGFSREQETQSDDLGIRYMARAGYDPRAMAGFLRKLRAESKLQARLRGDSPDKIDQFSYMATHPAPIERVRRAEARARSAKVRGGMLATDIYLGKIDGMLFGDDPEQGYVRGRVFTHPRLRFRFEVPPGFRLFNARSSVVALGPGKARIMFDQARKPVAGPIGNYLTRIWARNLGLRNVETITVDGREAATGATRIRTSAGPRDVRLVAIRAGSRRLYRFLFLIPPSQSARLAAGLRRTTYSFRTLNAAEARALRPLRIHIERVRRGDTARSLARGMAFDDFRLERFEMLNGLGRNAPLVPGRMVKIIAE